jgi:membrane protease YdiL (CAAX protease family)
VPFLKSIARSIGMILLGVAFIAAPMALFKLGILPPLQAALGLGDKPSPWISPPGMLLAMVSGYWAYVRLIERRAATELTLRPAQLLFAVLLAVVLIGAPVLVLYALGYYHLLSYAGVEAIWAAILILIPAAVLEELVFRGLMFSILERQFDTITALLVQSVIFAAVHMSNPGFGGLIDMFAGVLIGAFWTLLFVLWRNIWSVGLHHAAWNLTIVLTGLPLSGLEDFRSAAPFRSVFEGPELMTGGHAGPEASVVTLAVAAIATGVVLWLARRRQQIRVAA